MKTSTTMDLCDLISDLRGERRTLRDNERTLRAANADLAAKLKAAQDAGAEWKRLHGQAREDVTRAQARADELSKDLAQARVDFRSAHDAELRLDADLTRVRVALTEAGIPESEPYPEEPGLSDREKSLRAGGKVIAQDERVRRLAAEVVRLRPRDTARMGYDGALSDVWNRIRGTTGEICYQIDKIMEAIDERVAEKVAEARLDAAKLPPEKDPDPRSAGPGGADLLASEPVDADLLRRARRLGASHYRGHIAEQTEAGYIAHVFAADHLSEAQAAEMMRAYSEGYREAAAAPPPPPAAPEVQQTGPGAGPAVEGGNPHGWPTKDGRLPASFPQHIGKEGAAWDAGRPALCTLADLRAGERAEAIDDLRGEGGAIYFSRGTVVTYEGLPERGMVRVKAEHSREAGRVMATGRVRRLGPAVQPKAEPRDQDEGQARHLRTQAAPAAPVSAYDAITPDPVMVCSERGWSV